MRFRPGAFLIRCALVLAVLLAAINLLEISVRFPILPTVALGVAAWKKLHRWQASDAYGSAKPASLLDLWRHGMIGSDFGIFIGTCGYIEPPSRAQGLRALFSIAMPSSLAVRLFFAAFFGKRWMDG